MAYLKKPGETDENGNPIQGSEAGFAGAGSGGPQGAPGSTAPASYTQVSTLTGKKIFDKNKGASPTANLFGDIQSNIDKTRQASDTGLADYTKKIGEQGNALQFNEGNALDALKYTDQGNVNNLFAGQDLAQPQFGYNPYDIQQSGTSGGLQAALRGQASKGGQNYGRGMAALDAGIYMPSQGLQSQIGGLLNQYSASANKMAENKTAAEGFKKSAQADVGNRANQFVGGLRNELAGIQSGAEAAGSRDARIQREGSNSMNTKAARSAIDPVAENAAMSAYYALSPEDQAKISRKELKEMVKQSANTPTNKYARYDEAQGGAYYTQQQADRANALQSMLGMGGSPVTASGQAQLSVDEQGLSDAVSKNASAWLQKLVAKKSGAESNAAKKSADTQAKTMADAQKRISESKKSSQQKAKEAKEKEDKKRGVIRTPWMRR